MGFHDTIKLGDKCEAHGFPLGTVFETKSLHADNASFSVTTDGRLVEHLFRYENDPETDLSFGCQLLTKRVAIGDQVIEYHGDILLMNVAPVADLKMFVARFTHGRLEWIHPEEAYAAENRELLAEQCSR